MDCFDLDEEETNNEREKQQLQYKKRQQRKERGEIVRRHLLEKSQGAGNEPKMINCQGGWNILRQRTDKQANGPKVAEAILQTIKDPVEEEDLKALMQDIEQSDFAAVNDASSSRKRKRSDEDFDEDL